ncbi:MAG TPA: hypothetical protein VFO57_10875 [Burkholderiales bacterium]|nr:hypothetical protein [Burkholderiales bacterium]
MRRWAWILALTTAVATTSYAQLTRQLPANGKLGEMIGQQHLFPLVQINDKVLRLAPGGRIIDENNRTLLHAYLPQHAYVLFVEDMNGDLSRVYILRADELEQLKRAR